MDVGPARIHAHSRRQAMDWSLVLVSQGIETTIDYSEEGDGWGLLVESVDYERAVLVLRQYRLENRGWPWQQRVMEPGLLFDWGSLAWAALVCVFFWLSGVHSGLEAAGIMDSTAVVQGQWWRLFTAVWLHADLAHLGANASLGVVLLGLAMGRYGTGVGLLAAYLAGVGGNVFAGLLSVGPHRSLGASGMVMGSLGLLAVQSWALRKRDPHAAKVLLTGVLGGVLLFVLVALGPNSDLLAHAGGFLCGLVLGTLLSGAGHRKPHGLLNFLAGLGFAVLVVWPWWLALSHMGFH